LASTNLCPVLLAACHLLVAQDLHGSASLKLVPVTARLHALLAVLLLGLGAAGAAAATPANAHCSVLPAPWPQLKTLITMSPDGGVRVTVHRRS